MSKEQLIRQKEYAIIIKESKNNKISTDSWFLNYCKEYERTCKEVGGKNE